MIDFTKIDFGDQKDMGKLEYMLLKMGPEERFVVTTLALMRIGVNLEYLSGVVADATSVLGDISEKMDEEE